MGDIVPDRGEGVASFSTCEDLYVCVFVSVCLSLLPPAYGKVMFSHVSVRLSVHTPTQTCYTEGGMRLAFTQENFLVSSRKRQSLVLLSPTKSGAGDQEEKGTWLCILNKPKPD